MALVPQLHPHTRRPLLAAAEGIAATPATGFRLLARVQLNQHLDRLPRAHVPVAWRVRERGAAWAGELTLKWCAVTLPAHARKKATDLDLLVRACVALTLPWRWFHIGRRPFSNAAAWPWFPNPTPLRTTTQVRAAHSLVWCGGKLCMLAGFTGHGYRNYLNAVHLLTPDECVRRYNYNGISPHTLNDLSLGVICHCRCVVGTLRRALLIGPPGSGPVSPHVPVAPAPETSGWRTSKKVLPTLTVAHLHQSVGVQVAYWFVLFSLNRGCGLFAIPVSRCGAASGTTRRESCGETQGSRLASEVAGHDTQCAAGRKAIHHRGRRPPTICALPSSSAHHLGTADASTNPCCNLDPRPRAATGCHAGF
jgi:hypothetical protein